MQKATTKKLEPEEEKKEEKRVIDPNYNPLIKNGITNRDVRVMIIVDFPYFAIPFQNR